MNLPDQATRSNVSRRSVRRPNVAGRRLLAGGAVLLLTAVVSSAGLAVAQIDGYRWDSNSFVPTDGEPHTVTLSNDRAAMVWYHQTSVPPVCTAVDTDTDQALPLAPPEGTYIRNGGFAGEWSGLATFNPQSTTVELTCTLGEGRTHSSINVAVETAPTLPPMLATFGAWVALPAILTFAGLLAVLAAVSLSVRRMRSGSRRQ